MKRLDEKNKSRLSGHCVWDDGISGSKHKPPAVANAETVTPKHWISSKKELWCAPYEKNQMEDRKKIDGTFIQQFQEKLKRQLREHRKRRKLSQSDTAYEIGVSERTYQRWESSGRQLTDIFTLLSVFQELDFSTAEIIDMMGLTPLTLNEVKAIYQDEDTLKNIKGHEICSVMREKCPDMDDFNLERLLDLLLKEDLKRLERRLKNP